MTRLGRELEWAPHYRATTNKGSPNVQLTREGRLSDLWNFSFNPLHMGLHLFPDAGLWRARAEVETASHHPNYESPQAAETALPPPRDITSRDVFRCAVRLWPFLRPYRRHLLYLLVLTIPALPVGLASLTLTRIAFDVVGHGRPLTATDAFLLRLPMGASRETVLWRLCVFVYVGALFAVPYGAVMITYSTWLLQRATKSERVSP